MNADLILSDGRHVKPDAYWADARLVVELDSASFHHTRHAFEDDRRRDSALAAEGYLTVRFTWRRLTHEADDLLDELRRVRWARLSGTVRGV
jgi:very-short-patch-repair endonuclease